MKIYEDLLVLIPTTGDILKLNRSLRTLDNSAKHLDIKIEILISLNSKQKQLGLDLTKFSNLTIQLQKLPRFFDSAEESTLEALRIIESKIESEKYIWILGDDDFVLPFGLEKLLSEVSIRSAKVLFFNSFQTEKKGKILSGPFIHSFEDYVDSDFTNFALKCGINYSPTGFGRLVVHSSLIKNLEFWDELIASGGPIFSYVTYFMYALKNSSFKFINTPLIIYRQNDYHEGNHDMWLSYAKRRKTLEFAPWTIELINQVKLLIANNIITLKEIRCSTIIEREIAYRFPVLILEQFHEQMRVAIQDKKQVPDSIYMNEMSGFLTLIAPDLAPIVEEIEDLYLEIKSKLANKNIVQTNWQRIRNMIVRLRVDKTYEGLVIDYYRGFTVFEHIDGYIAVNSNLTQVKFAYCILNPKCYSQAIFAETMSELRNSISNRESNLKSDFPLNIFDQYEISTKFDNSYSQTVINVLESELRIWERIPYFIKKPIKKMIIRSMK